MDVPGEPDSLTEIYVRDNLYQKPVNLLLTVLFHFQNYAYTNVWKNIHGILQINVKIKVALNCKTLVENSFLIE